MFFGDGVHDELHRTGDIHFRDPVRQENGNAGCGLDIVDKQLLAMTIVCCVFDHDVFKIFAHEGSEEVAWDTDDGLVVEL